MDIEKIKELREMTGAGMMDAKKALNEAENDIEKAVEILRVKGIAKAEKRAGREASAGLIESYIHGGKIGVLVEINCETDFVARTDEFKEFAQDIAMHVAASSPKYVDGDDVPEEEIEKEREILKKEAKELDKPDDIIEKMIEGKIKKFTSEICLLQQPFVKDTDKTVDQVRKELVGTLGENIVIRRFSRIELGGM